MLRVIMFVAVFVLVSSAEAQFPHGATARFETDPACDPQLGQVMVEIDAFGAFGDRIANPVDSGYFDPAGDVPDAGLVRTVFQSMPYLCHTSADGMTQGTWLDTRRLRDQAQAVQHGNVAESSFSAVDIEIEASYRLNCTALELCYTFTNVSGRQLTVLSLTPNFDPDLHFSSNNRDNDFGATNVGSPRTVWGFDRGAAPVGPTVFVGLRALDVADPYLHSWEIGSYTNLGSRISAMGGGNCHELRNDINFGGEDGDLNRDLVTDEMSDIVAAIRYDLGPLGPGEVSPQLCYAIEWHYGSACSDEDGDEICFPIDNCPTVPNPERQKQNGYRLSPSKRAAAAVPAPTPHRSRAPTPVGAKPLRLWVKKATATI